MSTSQQQPNEEGNANLQQQSGTPAVVKRRQLGQIFMSPTDNMSPWTLKLMEVKGHPNARKLPHLASTENKPPKLDLGKEN